MQSNQILSDYQQTAALWVHQKYLHVFMSNQQRKDYSSNMGSVTCFLCGEMRPTWRRCVRGRGSDGRQITVLSLSVCRNADVIHPERDAGIIAQACNSVFAAGCFASFGWAAAGGFMWLQVLFVLLIGQEKENVLSLWLLMLVY